jgi:hypothetical protein
MPLFVITYSRRNDYYMTVEAPNQEAARRFWNTAEAELLEDHRFTDDADSDWNLHDIERRDPEDGGYPEIIVNAAGEIQEIFPEPTKYLKTPNVTIAAKIDEAVDGMEVI